MSFNHRKCVKCGKTRIQDSSVTYHRFPVPGDKNIQKALAWAKFCWPNKDFKVEELDSFNRSGKMLCGRHFKTTDFYDSKRTKLSLFAIPSVIVEEDSIILITNKENILEENIQLTLDTNVKQKERKPFSEIKNIIAYDQPSTSRTSLDLSVLSTSYDTQQSTSRSNTGTAVGQDPIQLKTKNDGKILSSLKVSKISQLTPREQKLYKICRKNINEVARLRKKIKNRKGNISVVSEHDSIKNLLNLNVSNSFVALLQSQIRNCPKNPKGRRYSLEEKGMALVMYKKSPACYRLLRRMFTLPCQSSLNKLLNRIPFKPGINNHIFTALKKMSRRQCDEDNICILCFDEMAVRRHLWYDRKSDQIQGFQDHGNHGRNGEVATKALVFMLSGVRKKWKQPIAFYLSHTINANRMTVIVKEILTECFHAKMNVVATVCDLSTVNMKVLKTLGATTEKPFFSLCEKEIVTILDPPHLLKCTRNLFMKHNVKCSIGVQSTDNDVKGIAKWSDIKEFYEIDKNSNFVFAPALTEHHLNPNLKEQMRVKLAAQIFSHSVTAGILTYIANNKLPSTALATATLCQNFDELFDALNADSSENLRGKPYSINITKNSAHHILFKKMKKFIVNMTYIESKKNPPSQNGWIHTINAVERLWRNLQRQNILSLATRRLNQDPLENFFGCIRYSCGSNNNPTYQQFVAGAKTAIISNLRHSGQKRNCENDTAILANNFKTLFSTETKNLEIQNDIEYNIEELELLVADAVEKIDLATSESQACAYVSGFILKKLQQSDCPMCCEILLTNYKETIHIFTSFREYASQDSLIYCNKTFITCVEIMASIVNRFLENNAWMPNLRNKIMMQLESVDYSFFNKCQEHFSINISNLKTSVFFICMKRFVILKNREIDETERQKAMDRKLKILRNK